MGFTITIFCPDGLRLVNKLNWSGTCIVCPRAKFVENKARDEFKRPGLYVLVGASEDSDLPTVYVGEGDPILHRLAEHFAKKNFWVQLIAFSSKDQSLTKTHIHSGRRRRRRVLSRCQSLTGEELGVWPDLRRDIRGRSLNT